MQLHIRVVDAAGIASMDVGGKSDPYCIMKLRRTRAEFKTSVKKGTLTPTWNEEFHFSLPSEDDVLEILMKDQDPLRDDAMAELYLNLQLLSPGYMVDRYFDMDPVKGVKQGGKLHLVLHLAYAGQPPFVRSA
jgi:Ca2+-dependent lipid-binding protein